MFSGITILSIQWLAWMAVLATVYWILPLRARTVWIGASCLAFLAGNSPVSALVVLAMGLVAWLGGAARGHRGLATTAICAGIVAVLAGFKLGAQAAAAQGVQQWLLPLGISYYSFRCIHYALERYKGSLPPHSFGEFSAYVLFLPTFSAGPIHRFPEFHRDLVGARLDTDKLARGLERIVYGYAKIAILGNLLVVALLMPLAASLQADAPWRAAYLATIAQGLNAYLQFAGYSDIAIGCALVLGFRIIENFDAPFLATNIGEFWRRWHISLTAWCREYVYTSVVSVWRRPALAALLTMLVVGLWHEISLRYVLWGLWHGVGLAAWQFHQLRRRRLGHGAAATTVVGRIAGFMLTFHYVMFSFVLLGDRTLAESFGVLRVLLTGSP